MSWLSQGLRDIGLGGVNKFFDTAIKPVVENPWADLGIAAGIALPFLAPEIGGALGLGGAAAEAAGAGAGAGLDLTTLGGVGSAGLGAGLDTSAISAPAALGFGGDVAAGGSLTDFLANPAAAAGGGLPSDVSALAAPGGAVGGGSALPLTSGGLIDPAAAEAAAPSLSAAAAGDATDLASLSAADYASAVPGVGTAGISGTAGGVPPATPGILDKITGALTGPTAKAAGTVAGLGGLGYNLYSGYQQKQQLNALNKQEQQNAATIAQNATLAQGAAGPALNTGQLLTSYLTTGTLPQSIQAQVDQQVAGTKAAIIQGYATRNMSTNPQQNSALAADLAAVDVQKESLMGTLQQQLATAGQQMIQTATNLLNSGTSATQISANIPIMMQNLDIKLSKLTSESISSFAAALNGGTRPAGGGQNITLNIPQAAA